MPQPQKPEQIARDQIDAMLTAAGWQLQNIDQINLSPRGVAVREYPTTVGFVDYMLFVDRKPVGVIEAKPEGTSPSGVETQSDAYLRSTAKHIPIDKQSLTFGYISTGTETHFYDVRDPDCRPRLVFAFHRPETLADWLSQPTTLRGRLRALPPLIKDNLRECQIRAIEGLEKSFANNRPRALIQMATGSGKSFCAVNFVYRLIKYAGAKRVLFLVDRNTLGRQARTEFQQFQTPDDHRKFTELYNIQLLSSSTLDPVCKVTISTIQRLFSMLKGQEYDPELDELSTYEFSRDGEVKAVEYNPAIPIEAFDIIITDECHRSIYNQWRQVLEYFDAFLIGLTATPSAQTMGFFERNIVSEYTHTDAIADGVNVGYEVYRIKTQITETGASVEAGNYVDKRNKKTRKIHWEQLDDALDYGGNQLDRDVVAIDQIRTVVRTFRDKLFTDIFPGRTVVPKTLVFAKNDSHAEDIVQIIRTEFNKGKDFCKKITYQTYKTGEKAEDLIQAFRMDAAFRIAVTVDMISTGTDIKPLECLLFMRDIKSVTYFEQMKGRGTRTIDTDALQMVSPDAKHKTHFVIVDAVGVCETDKGEARPLERKKSVPFDKLIQSVAMGSHDEATLASLGNRLARMERQLSKEDLQTIQQTTGGKPLKQIIHGLFNAFDPDVQHSTACEKFQTTEPTEDQLLQVETELAAVAALPFDDAALRNQLIVMKQELEQTIDTTSMDVVLDAAFSDQAKQAAEQYIQSWKTYLEENRDQITALQIIFGTPYGQRKLTYDAIKELAKVIDKPPYHFQPDRLWQCYQQLERHKVRGTPQTILTDLVSLVRFASGMEDELVHYPDLVALRFGMWLTQQQETGRKFTPQQLEWLQMIKDHIATSVEINEDDFEGIPFIQKGGIYKFSELFGNDYRTVLDDLNLALAS